MKMCPQCRTIYTDDSLQYCLQDGTPLVNSAATNDWTESETVVSPKRTTNKDLPPQSRETFTDAVPRKSNTGLIVAFTILLTLLAVVAAIFGVLYYRAVNKREIAQNVNSTKPANNAVSNINQNSNINSSVSSNIEQTPTVTPTPIPTLNPKEIKKIKSGVKDTVENWKDALEDHDLDELLNNYAPTVDYYNLNNVAVGKIRADKQRALELYDDINIKISNFDVTPDETGEKATAVFDKEWNFEGEGGRFSSGKVRQQLQFAKIGGKWLITSERDLKTYYTSR